MTFFRMFSKVPNTSTNMFCAQIFDNNNGISFNTKFASKKEAANYLVDQMNPNLTREEFHANNGKLLWLNEHEGKLYDHWMNEGYDGYCQLFENYDESKPTTIKGLRKWIEDNPLLIGWADRASVTYSVLPVRTHFHGFEYDPDQVDEVNEANWELFGPYDIHEGLIGYWTNEECDLSEIREILLKHGFITANAKPVFIEAEEFIDGEN